MSAPDGGAAFPRSTNHDMLNADCFAQDGMTLRDYFAAQAIIAVFGSPPMTFNVSSKEQGVAVAYEIADAMLEARKT